MPALKSAAVIGWENIVVPFKYKSSAIANHLFLGANYDLV
jgi:hypothetical protein